MNCNICDTETHIINDTQFDLNYHRCPKCQLIHLDKSSKITFEEERTVYDLHENSLEDEGYVNYFLNFLDKGVLPFKQEGELLDFGSGPEPVLIQLIDRDFDFNTNHYDLHYNQNDSYKAKSYDVILSTEVIEHVWDPLDFMQHLSSLLEPNGILSIMTLIHHNDEESFLKWWYRHDETHITFYTEVTMRKLASLCGLDLIYCDNKRIFTFRKTA